jgi:hypothetical protein
MALAGLIPDPPKGGVKLTLTAEEAKREAMGRALILLGSTVGIVGSSLVLMNNPLVKAKVDTFWNKTPTWVQNNKPFVIIGVGLLGAGVLTYLIRKGVVKFWEV